MATYLETLGKLQQQSLEALKPAQATQLAALTTLGELVSDVPAFRPASVLESIPTFAELPELNAAFARNVLEQQTRSLRSSPASSPRPRRTSSTSPIASSNPRPSPRSNAAPQKCEMATSVEAAIFLSQVPFSPPR